ncbi:MAG TPA: M20/M25/M40 family metallo-hydrolase [Terriglobales bacterium]|nr:M20/M25/M40 family metallo-hydrolase [Terriglobales bacterium]
MLTPSLMVAQTARPSHGPEEAPARTHDPLFLPQSPRPSPSRPKVLPDPAIAAALREVSAARIRASIERLVSFGTRLTISSSDPQAVASGRGIGAAREWIKAEFERYSQDCGGCLEVKTDTFMQEPARRVPKPTEIVNVYAVLRGTDPVAAKRIFLVTGHYDSRPSNDQDTTALAPGANDDGSGTAVSLECARVLSKHRFPATIIFLTVAGEEQGLYGSRHFAKMAREQGWNLEAVLNNDIVGGDRSSGQDASVVRVFSEGIPANATETEVKTIRGLGGESDSPSRELARYIRETGRTYLPATFSAKLIFRPDRYLRGGDHTSFNEEGFAAVRMTEYRENFNHQHQDVRTENGIEYGDLPKFVDYEYVANVARLNAATLASLASAPPLPSNLRLETRKLENDSTLIWDPLPEGSAVVYEVLWRPTTAAEWENVQAAGKGPQATIDRSKDNVVFAVRAVDGKGHRSLPALPKPER